MITRMRCVDMLRTVMFVAAVVSVASGMVAIPFNAAAGHWRLVAFNVGCIALCALFLLGRHDDR